MSASRSSNPPPEFATGVGQSPCVTANPPRIVPSLPLREAGRVGSGRLNGQCLGPVRNSRLKFAIWPRRVSLTSALSAKGFPETPFTLTRQDVTRSFRGASYPGSGGADVIRRTAASSGPGVGQCRGQRVLGAPPAAVPGNDEVGRQLGEGGDGGRDHRFER